MLIRRRYLKAASYPIIFNLIIIKCGKLQLKHARGILRVKIIGTRQTLSSKESFAPYVKTHINLVHMGRSIGSMLLSVPTKELDTTNTAAN